MTTRDRLSTITTFLRLTLALAIGLFCVAPRPAPAASGIVADLGLSSGLKILDGSTCGQYMTTQALDSQCDSASANHWIILGWDFNPNSCSAPPCAKPDGFNIVRSTPGAAASVFTTQPTDPNQTTRFGTILQNVKGDENIGACFSVVPFRGVTDFGRASNSVCIEEIMHLAPTRWGTAHSYSHNDGSFCFSSPTSNSFAYQLMFMNNGANSGKTLFAGYVSRTETPGGCNRYDDFYQGLVYFDLSKLAGKHVSSAKLRLQVVAGAYNPGVPNHDSDGAQQRVNTNCVSSIGFPTNVSVGSDPAFPQLITFDRFAGLNGGVGQVDVDITGMVRAWLNPGGVNRGIVLSPSLLSHDATISQANAFNAACLSQFREPTLDVDLH